MAGEPLIRSIDSIQIRVPDVDAGLAFYRDALGHSLVWRSADSAGLRLPESEAEIVLQAERPGIEPNLLVESADEAVDRVRAAGGTVVREPFDIPVGRVAVVADPFGNPLVLIDLSKGRYRTDADGKVLGVKP